MSYIKRLHIIFVNHFKNLFKVPISILIIAIFSPFKNIFLPTNKLSKLQYLPRKIFIQFLKLHYLHAIFLHLHYNISDGIIDYYTSTCLEYYSLLLHLLLAQL